ncbi:winged helix-turn-helix transcriptional regulator [Nguyenibacter vanlangensis]|uniref:Winged helix-turn-helix transcriptional regulator n=1 Tax=Nguyenibacter vanlangensis TaxID=1216886 RepID=A0ABZ3D047_9PROT
MEGRWGVIFGMHKNAHITLIVSEMIPSCPLFVTNNYGSDARTDRWEWKEVTLFHLLRGTTRFNSLRKRLPTVTLRMLTARAPTGALTDDADDDVNIMSGKWRLISETIGL